MFCSYENYDIGFVLYSIVIVTFPVWQSLFIEKGVASEQIRKIIMKTTRSHKKLIVYVKKATYVLTKTKQIHLVIFSLNYPSVILIRYKGLSFPTYIHLIFDGEKN